MKSTIRVGNRAVSEFTVTENMRPSFRGKVIHPVCSTWDLAHQFEIAARMTLEPHLERDEQGIGTHLSIDHVKPILIGKFVSIEASIIELDGSTVICDLVALVDGVICATGKQIQRVLSADKIDQIIKLGADD